MSLQETADHDVGIESMDWVSRFFEEVGGHADHQQLLLRTGEWLEQLVGLSVAACAMRALLVGLYAGNGHAAAADTKGQQALGERVDREGWRAVLEASDEFADWPSLASLFEQLYAYAVDGVVLDTRLPNEVAARRVSLEELVTQADRYMALLPPNWVPQPQHAWSIPGIYASASARWKLDRSEPLTSTEVARLARLDDKTVLNALGKQLLPDAEGKIPADAARAWLLGRRPRKFRPSRWLDASDDQDSRAPGRADEDTAIVMVPVDAQGQAFLPTLARPTRGAGAGRLGFRIGPKGEEFVVHDYFVALAALKDMRPARWRRPNAEGNWGIVRAEPNWQPMARAEIDLLLQEAGLQPSRLAT